jgi:hypothetical protein
MFILAYSTSTSTFGQENSSFIRELVTLDAMRMFRPSYFWWNGWMVPAIMIVAVDPATFLALDNSPVRIGIFGRIFMTMSTIFVHDLIITQKHLICQDESYSPFVYLISL